MSYAYLDHNIVDRIDTHLQEPLVRFLDEKALTPVVSTASLVEIERGEQAERVTSNIKALLAIGARFILEGESDIYIDTLSLVRVLELLASKNELIEDTVYVLNAAHFYLNSWTSKNEIEQRISEVTDQMRELIDRYDHTDTKIPSDLLNWIDTMETLREEGVPSEYNFSDDLRSKLAMNPQEINNLKPQELWKKIAYLTQVSGASLPFDLSEGSVKERLFNVLLTLNVLGYWPDSIDSRKRQLAFNYDCMHGIYGTLCRAVISSDKRFIKRLRAAYHYMCIPTQTVLVVGEQFIEETD